MSNTTRLPEGSAPVRVQPGNARGRFVAGLALVGLVWLNSAAKAGIIVTLGDPRAEFANLTGTNGICSTLAGSECVYGTETFAGWSGGGFTSAFTTGQNSFPTGESITGIYGGAITHDTNNTYGGAYGTQPYPSANGTAQYTLNLTSIGIPGVNYLGMWITAMDASNKLTLYSDGVPVFSFVSSDLRAAINLMPTPSLYYGDPDNGRDTSEPFAYVNVFDTTGYFDAVQFTHNGGSSFESSNHSVGYFNPPNINGTAVAITTNTAQVPEPSSLAVLSIGLGVIGAAGAIRRRRATMRV